jgi:hypothetical protein
MAEKMRIDSDMLTPKQKHAVILLVRGATVSQVAKDIGVAETTVYNWKVSDYFIEDLKDEARCYVDEIRLTLSGFMVPAMDRLRELIDDEDPSVALKAIDRVLKATGYNEFDPHKYVFRHLGLETELYEGDERERKMKEMSRIIGW